MRAKFLKFDAHKVPQFKEERSKAWVLYGVEAPYRNRYPDYLLELFNASAKNNAIIRGKTDYIVGKGFAVSDTGLTTEGEARLNQFIQEPNKDEDLNSLLAKTALDLEIFGGFALEIIYNQTSEKIAAIHHADFSKYRKAKEGDFYFYSDNWAKSKPETVAIDAFDWNNPQGKQLLYVKSYHPQSQAYPLPEYLGAVPYIEMDKELANFHLQGIKNNFQGGKLVNFFNGQPTEEEQDQIERKFKSKFTGTDNANSLVLNFSDSKEQGAEILNLDGNDFDKRYQILEDTVCQNIFTGHRIVDPQLFGIKEDGIFSSRNQIRDSYELFQNTYVNSRQRILESVYNGLADIQGFKGRLEIIDTEPIGLSFSEATRVSVMSEGEIRQEMGLVVEEQETEAVDSKTKDAQAALKGSVGGVTGIITLLQNVKSGLIPIESAISVLVELYGFNPETARATVTGEVIPERVAAEMKDTLKEADIELRICEQFGKCGLSLDEWEVVEGREVRFNSEKELELSEDRIKRYGFGSEAFDMTVLELLKKDATLTYEAIAAQLETTIDEVALAVQNLASRNYLTVGTETIADTAQRSIDVTTEGTKALETAEPLSVSLKIAYRYIKSGEASGASVIPTTRDFCKDMVAQSQRRVWTSAEIQQIGITEDRNVWLRRGGFWTRKGTNTTTPYCRHVWEQVVIQEKNG